MPKGNPGIKRKSLQQQFDEHRVKAENGCWLWTGCKDKGGYGFIRHQGKNQRAHRISLFLQGQVVPADLQVLHHCDNPSCVNPQHLYVGTNRDNQQDAVKRGRHRSGTILTKSIAECIRFGKTIGLSQEGLSRFYGVSNATISRIINGKRWI